MSMSVKLFQVLYSLRGNTKSAFIQADDESQAKKDFRAAIKNSDEKGDLRIISCTEY